MQETPVAFRLVPPGTVLCLWFLALVVVQAIHGAWALLLVPFTVVGLCFFGGQGAFFRARHLVWRSRWLLLTLVLVLSWGVPGEALWGWSWGPTKEGLLAAALHALRLILSLVLVAGLLNSLPGKSFLTGLYVLSSPLRSCGVPCERGLLRMMLVLRLVDDAKVRDWRVLLHEGENGLFSKESELEIESIPMKFTDKLLIGFSLLLVCVLGWFVWSRA